MSRECSLPGCQRAATMQCSGCREADYCSPEHQRDDWLRPNATDRWHGSWLLVKAEDMQLPRTQGHKVICKILQYIATADLEELNGERKAGHPLLSSCGENQHDCVRLLLERGVDTERTCAFNKNYSALTVACMAHHPEIIRLLVAAGADVKKNGELFLSCKENDVELGRMLIEKGANLERKNAHGQTAVHVACMNDALEYLQLLLDHRADTRVCDALQRSPLHIVCELNHAGMVEMLVLGGAILNAKDSTGRTPMTLAKEMGHADCMGALEKAGVAPWGPRMGDIHGPRKTPSPKEMRAAAKALDKAALVAGPKPGNALTHPKPAMASCPTVKVALKASPKEKTPKTKASPPPAAACHFTFLPTTGTAQVPIAGLSESPFKHLALAVQFAQEKMAVRHGDGAGGEAMWHDSWGYDVRPQLQSMELDEFPKDNYQGKLYFTNLRDAAIDAGVIRIGRRSKTSEKRLIIDCDMIEERGALQEWYPEQYIKLCNAHAPEVQAIINAAGGTGAAAAAAATAVAAANRKATCGASKKAMDIFTEADADARARMVILRATPLKNKTKAVVATAAAATAAMAAITAPARKGNKYMGDITEEDFALIKACTDKNLDAARRLLQQGVARVRAQDRHGWEPIMIAAHNGPVEMVKMLLLFDAEIECGQKHGFPPLIAATTAKQLDVLRFLLAEGADVDIESRGGLTALMHAAVNPSGGTNVDVVKTLLAGGATLVPLCDVMPHPNVVVVRQLIKAAGPNVNDMDGLQKKYVSRKDFRGFSPLAKCCEAGRIELARCLVAKGADIQPKATSCGNTALHFACARPDGVMFARLLLDKGAKAAIRNKEGKTPWDIATEMSHLDCLDALENFGDMRAMEDLRGLNTPRPPHLNHGQGNKSPATSTRTVENVYPQQSPGPSPAGAGKKALKIGTKRCRFFSGRSGCSLGDKCKFIHDSGGGGGDRYDSDDSDSDSSTSEDEELQQQREVMSKVTKDAKAGKTKTKGPSQQVKGKYKPSQQHPPKLAADNDDDISPERQLKMELSVACYDGDLEKVRGAMRKGADPNTIFKYGFTPIMVASREGHLEVVRLLVDAGGDVNAKKQGEYTALHQACQGGFVSLVHLLSASGADIHAEARGKDGAALAREGGHESCVKALLLAEAMQLHSNGPPSQGNVDDNEHDDDDNDGSSLDGTNDPDMDNYDEGEPLDLLGLDIGNIGNEDIDLNNNDGEPLDLLGLDIGSVGIKEHDEDVAHITDDGPLCLSDEFLRELGRDTRD